ncbi:MAG: RluA family pseudouridine synthase [Treponema sp.]|nr:RluA family pseudouridine synthase [Treponema sp.]
MKDFSIIFENDEILLVNKECGVAVQGGAGIKHSLDQDLPLQVGYKVHLVHRLDRETSGILVVAKNPVAAAKWTKLIQTDRVRKEYTALCFGVPQVKGKECTKGRLEGTVEAHGRTQSAETFFEVERTFEVEIAEGGEPGSQGATEGSIPEPGSCEKLRMSVLRITLGTGRMHQIRIQMAKANAPLLADDKHGNFRLNKLARKIGVKKLHLAASRLTLELGGRTQTFEIPLPEHMEKTMNLAGN